MSTAGFFGKVPALGDFVTHRLSHDFARTWDDWLQRALCQSRNALGETWLEAYLTCPFWRFILSPGVCGPEPWIGVLMPSVDRVGRHFPLTLALPLHREDNPFALAATAGAWYDRAEAVMLSALSDTLEIDTFDAHIAALPAFKPGTTHASSAALPTGMQCSDWRVALPSAACVALAYPALLHRMACRSLGPYSIWSTSGSPQVAASLLLCAGLPAPQRFAALLDGSWHQRAWEDFGLPTHESDALDTDQTCAGPVPAFTALPDDAWASSAPAPDDTTQVSMIRPTP